MESQLWNLWNHLWNLILKITQRINKCDSEQNKHLIVNDHRITLCKNKKYQLDLY